MRIDKSMGRRIGPSGLAIIALLAVVRLGAESAALEFTFDRGFKIAAFSWPDLSVAESVTELSRGGRKYRVELYTTPSSLVSKRHLIPVVVRNSDDGSLNNFDWILVKPRKLAVCLVDGRVWCYRLECLREDHDPISGLSGYSGIYDLVYLDEDGDGRFELLKVGRDSIGSIDPPEWAGGAANE